MAELPVYSADIWCAGSDLVNPHKEALSFAQQRVGSDNNNYTPRGT